MDAGSREAVNSSGQLEEWAAGVAADLKDEDDVTEDPRRRTAEQAVSSPARQRAGTEQTSTTVKRLRIKHERESSPDEDNEARDGSRPKLPRPDKKEPCPRCNSMDTKFCYYNNYNIKQPRFYCKTCQRYWTAGGTLRNIAPGSGRRKSKSKVVTKEVRGGPLLAEHLTAAASAAQTGVFGLPVNTATTYPALLAATADPSALLSTGAAAASGYPPLLAGQSSLTGLKLGGVQQLPGVWGAAAATDLHADAALRGHLQAQLGGGAAMSSSLGQQSGGVLDARLLLSGHHHRDELPSGMAMGHGAPLHPHQAHSQHRDTPHTSSPSGSPAPQQQQQVSSPQQPNSQQSQQPSPPQAQHHGSASEDLDVDCVEVCVQGRRVRLRTELDPGSGAGVGAVGLGAASLGPASGMPSSASLQNLQLASLSLPPSMASLAAVMGPGGGPSGLGTNLHPLLSQQDAAAGGLLDGSHAGGLSRHHLHLALQHHQAVHQAMQQQQDGFQQLNGLLPHNAVTAAAALQAQHPLLQGVGHPGAGAAAAPGSAAAAVAALDPLQRSALLQQAAGLGGVGCWLQGGNGVTGMLPSSAAMAAAALESLQAQSLAAASGASNLLQAGPHAGAAGSGAAADWLSLAAAAAAAAACPPRGQVASVGVSHPSAAAMAAAHAAGSSAMSGAAQVLQAQAAAAAAGSGCGVGVGCWPGSTGLTAVAGGAPSWSLWSSYNAPVSSNYAGYALQAAAAAYTNGR